MSRAVDAKTRSAEGDRTAQDAEHGAERGHHDSFRLAPRGQVQGDAEQEVARRDPGG